MAAIFDAYYKWLGIPPDEQPPNHYRLLGVPIFTHDVDVIENAADRQMAHLRTFQSGTHADASQKLLNEIAAARVCLLNLDKRRAYDAKLKTSQRAASVTKKPRPASVRKRPSASSSDVLDSALERSESKSSIDTRMSADSATRKAPRPARKRSTADSSVLSEQAAAGSSIGASHVLHESSEDSIGSLNLGTPSSTSEVMRQRSSQVKSKRPMAIMGGGAFAVMVVVLILTISFSTSDPEDETAASTTSKEETPSEYDFSKLNIDEGRKPLDRPPTIKSIAPQTVLAGAALTLRVLAQDAAGKADGLRYRLKSHPPDAKLNEFTGQFTWHSPPGDAGKTHNCTLEVEDLDGNKSEHAFDIVVTDHLAPPEDAELHLTFDEASRDVQGTVVTYRNQMADRGHHAQSINTQVVPGLIGDAVQYDATDSYLVIANDPKLAGGSDVQLSVSLWHKLPDAGQQGVRPGGWDNIISKTWDGSNKDWALVHDQKGLTYYSEKGGGDYRLTVDDVTLDTDWHHLAFTLDRPSRRLQVFFDGELVAINPRFPDESARTDADIYIGKSVYLNREHHGGTAGIVDELRIFTRALSASEVLALYQDGNKQGGQRKYQKVDPVEKPGDAEIAAARDEVKSLIGPMKSSDLVEVASSADQRAAVRYVLLEAALQKAITEGDPRQAVYVVDRLILDFRLEPSAAYREASGYVMKSGQAELAASLAEHVTLKARQALDADHAEQATALATIALALARSTADVGLVRAVTRDYLAVRSQTL